MRVLIVDDDHLLADRVVRAASMFTIGSAGIDACVAKPIMMSEVLNQVHHQRGADSRP